MSSWIGYNGQYTLNNYNIEHPIINGEHDTQGDDYQSVILINSPDDECISPIIFGFTLNFFLFHSILTPNSYLKSTLSAQIQLPKFTGISVYRFHN